MKELLQKANQDEIFYIDGKEFRKPHRIIDDLLTVESRSNHRTKHGSNSSGTGEKKSYITFGTHRIELHQDNDKEQEFWVYFDNHYIGRIDTYYFMSKEKARRIERESESKISMIEEKIDGRKIAFILLFISLIIAFVFYENIFNSNKVTRRTKRITWIFLIFFLGAIYFLFVNEVLLHSPFLISAILVYNLIVVSFCEKCGKMNYKNIFRLEEKNCSKCGDKLLGVFEKK